MSISISIQLHSNLISFHTLFWQSFRPQIAGSEKISSSGNKNILNSQRQKKNGLRTIKASDFLLCWRLSKIAKWLIHQKRFKIITNPFSSKRCPMVWTQEIILRFHINSLKTNTGTSEKKEIGVKFLTFIKMIVNHLCEYL